jgi:hypothetical protein
MCLLEKNVLERAFHTIGDFLSGEGARSEIAKAHNDTQHTALQQTKLRLEAVRSNVCICSCCLHGKTLLPTMAKPQWFKDFETNLNTNLDATLKAMETRLEATSKAMETRLETRLEATSKAMETRLEARIQDLQSTLTPFADDKIFNVPVVGAENHQLLDPMKRATYTWLNFIANENTVVGAAHCALGCYTFPVQFASCFSHAIFIELPEAVLNLGVDGIYLSEPYTSSFINPLPIEKDLVVVKVQSSPPSNKTIPTSIKLSPAKTKESRRSRVVGRGLGGAVSSFDGSVILETNTHSGGSVRFFLDRGEPGDSGTLLFVKNENTGTLSPLAVFRGLSPSLGPNYHKRGEGTILPTPDALTFLPVIDAQHLQNLVTTGVDLGDGLGKKMHFGVTPNPNGIVTVQAGTDSLSGVFVKAQNPIDYAGYADISVMRGQK